MEMFISECIKFESHIEYYFDYLISLTHWSRVTHICVDNITSIGSYNGLSPYRRQAIICTNAGILLTGPLGTNFSEISIEILTFSFTKMHLKISPGKWRLFCLGLNVLTKNKNVNTTPTNWTKYSVHPQGTISLWRQFRCGKIDCEVDINDMKVLLGPT